MSKIIRACTVPQSLGFVKGMLPDLGKKYEVVLVSSPGEQMDEIAKEYGVRERGKARPTLSLSRCLHT